ncbi:MAG: sialate O-acetylesterase [Draconibacterium sp.]
MKLQNNQLRIFILSVILLSNLQVFAQNPNFYIYLCFGQSNMEGQGTIEAQDRTVNSRFKVMEAVSCTNLGRTKGKWYTAVPPLCRCWSKLSPADYFGRTMIENLPDSITVGVINVSVAGCKIELFDKDNYQKYTSAITEDWLKNIIAEYNGNPYNELVELAKLAQKDGVIKGILLHQGESNTGDSQWPTKVKNIYNNLVTDLNLNPDSIPLLAGEVVHADQGGVCASMNTIIARLPQALPNSYVISSSKCTDATDNLHFNSAGYRELGKRYANKMLSLMGITPTAAFDIQLAKNNGFALEQNYPNPFSGKTAVSFTIPESCFVSLKLYNLLGVEIGEFAGKNYGSGNHIIEIDSKQLPKGKYFYRIECKNFSETREMTVF